MRRRRPAGWPSGSPFRKAGAGVRSLRWCNRGQHYGQPHDPGDVEEKSLVVLSASNLVKSCCNCSGAELGASRPCPLFPAVPSVRPAPSGRRQAVLLARKAEAVGRVNRQAAKQRPSGGGGAPALRLPQLWRSGDQPPYVRCEACNDAEPGQSAQVRASRSRAIAARKRALKEPVAAFGADPDPAIYRERIWPKLGAVKLAEIMEATGYVKGHCSTITAGTGTPHVSTWPALACLVGLDLADQPRPPELAEVAP